MEQLNKSPVKNGEDKREEKVIKFGMKHYDQKKFIPEFIEFYNKVTESLSLDPIDPIKKNQLMLEPMTNEKMEYFVGKVKELQKALGIKDDGIWGYKSKEVATRFVKKEGIDIKVPVPITSNPRYKINNEALNEYSKENLQVVEVHNATHTSIILGNNVNSETTYATISVNFKRDDGKSYFIKFNIKFSPGPEKLIEFNNHKYTLDEFNQLTGLECKIDGNKLHISNKSLIEIYKTYELISKEYINHEQPESIFNLSRDNILHFIVGVKNLTNLGYSREEAAKMLLRLQRKFGIINFARYSGKQLEKEYKLVDWKTGKLKIPKGKRINVSFAAYHDYNGAFMRLGKDIIEPAEKINNITLIYEGGNERQLSKAIRELRDYKYDLFISGHGNRESIRLGKGWGEESELDLTDSLIFKTMKNHVRNIVLYSCSTAQVKNDEEQEAWVADNIAMEIVKNSKANSLFAPPAPAYGILISPPHKNKKRGKDFNVIFQIKNPNKDEYIYATSRVTSEKEVIEIFNKEGEVHESLEVTPAGLNKRKN